MYTHGINIIHTLLLLLLLFVYISYCGHHRTTDATFPCDQFSVHGSLVKNREFRRQPETKHVGIYYYYYIIRVERCANNDRSLVIIVYMVSLKRNKLWWSPGNPRVGFAYCFSWLVYVFIGYMQSSILNNLSTYYNVDYIIMQIQFGTHCCRMISRKFVIHGYNGKKTRYTANCIK